MAKKTEGALARNLSRWMKARGLTNADVSAMTEETADSLIGRVDPSAIHRIATGKVPNPRVLTLAAICDVFGKSIDEAIAHETTDPMERPVRGNRRAPSRGLR